MKVIKRNGEEVQFDSGKIVNRALSASPAKQMTRFHYPCLKQTVPATCSAGKLHA